MDLDDTSIPTLDSNLINNNHVKSDVSLDKNSSHFQDTETDDNIELSKKSITGSQKSQGSIKILEYALGKKKDNKYCNISNDSNSSSQSDPQNTNDDSHDNDDYKHFCKKTKHKVGNIRGIILLSIILAIIVIILFLPGVDRWGSKYIKDSYYRLYTKILIFILLIFVLFFIIFSWGSKK